jgi:two-component system cell cycle sensor histidine kinase/response regulator CckA
MKFPLHILHLEDDPQDADLIQSVLESEAVDCAIIRVENQTEYVSALERGGIDLILSDYSLPTFDGLAAIRVARVRWPGIPVILVSGRLGELSIEALKNGATDYVMKDRLSRLAPAVRRAMLEVEALAERKRLKALFIEAQKMEVVGQLAGGVAHDFNNILAIIMGYGDMIRTELDHKSPLKKYVEEILQAAERAAALTQQLLVFSSKQTVQTVVLDLNQIVAELDKMLRRLIHENIEMEIHPGQQIGRIKADSGHIGQVLMNLVVNARDAMPKGGKLVITTINTTLDEDHARAHPDAVAGDYVMLSVSDTGTGMTAEVKTRLFEAFFTTKPKGKGTGLGLATCKTIVHQCGGFMDVRSEIGKGTVFKIYFPRVQQSLEAAVKTIHAGPLPGGTETLMVVEDDPSVRQMACSILNARGYEVLAATNGQDGLRVARDHTGRPIRLVLTDIVMPLMGGEVMAQWLKSSYPDLKIIYTSGYIDDAVTREGMLVPGVEFLPKPYTPAILSHKVRDLLDKDSMQRHGAEKGFSRASAFTS